MIELRQVTKTVESGGQPLTILHPLDLTVPPAQFLAITGPSGSGKSTLLGLIAGLDAPTAGRILMASRDVRGPGRSCGGPGRQRRPRLGSCSQFFHLIPSLTALENVCVPMSLELAGRHDAVARGRELLAEVGLTDRGHHYPSQLSGGEQQRVALARALSNNPPILLADEPTGNLDLDNGQHVMDLLLDIRRTRGATLMLATHDAALAARADARLRLRGGRVDTAGA